MARPEPSTAARWPRWTDSTIGPRQTSTSGAGAPTADVFSPELDEHLNCFINKRGTRRRGRLPCRPYLDYGSPSVMALPLRCAAKSLTCRGRPFFLPGLRPSVGVRDRRV